MLRLSRRWSLTATRPVIPEVGAEAFITGRHELYFRERDLFREGFKLR